MTNNHFNKSRHGTKPVFICECCGHATRLTSEAKEVCQHCFELAGIENYFTDNGSEALDDADSAVEAASYLLDACSALAAIRRNAGDEIADRVKGTFYIPWHRAA